MDSILYWNDVALEANRISFTNGKMEQPGPTLSSRALAIVHLAMYDAYAAIDPTAGNPYLPGLPSPAGTIQAAVASAAYRTLKALYPSQTALFDSRLSAAGDVSGPGREFGQGVADAILMDRQNDPDASAVGYVPSEKRGKHMVDPDNPAQGFHAPYYGAKSKGFAITARHELAPPPFDNPEYVKALEQVRSRGIKPELMGTLPDDIPGRTTNQTVIGIYWGYDGAVLLGTPPRLYNQIIRKIAINRNNTEAQNARLFALINVAMADAGILAWDQKYIHDFWRPVVGIREHDMSMGLAAVEANNNLDPDCDTGWLPLGAQATNSLNGEYVAQKTVRSFPHNQAVMGKMKNFTPNFPAYPSGHATFGAAAFHITRLFYGVDSGNTSADNLFDGLKFVSDEFNGVNQDNCGTVRPRHVRDFPGGLWQMIEENGLSRVALGVHWVFDAFVLDENNKVDLDRVSNRLKFGGVPLGLQIAEDIFSNNMTKSEVEPRR